MNRSLVLFTLCGLVGELQPATAQETEIRQSVQRTFAALNAGNATDLLSQYMPRAQVVFMGGGAIEELDPAQWRAAIARGHRYDWRPRQVSVQVHGAAAVSTAYVHGTLRLPGGAVVAGPWRYSETRVRQQGEWRIVQQHFSASGQNVGQIADARFRTDVPTPAYPEGTGPVVLIDEAHFNLHTAWGTYRPFADVLRRDGYVVRESDTPFTPDSLGRADLLVIANPMSPNLVDDITAPADSALDTAEVDGLRNWVHDGGALLLMIDHNPYPATAVTLAEAFGLRFLNCGAMQASVPSGRLMFRRRGYPSPAEPIPGPDAISYGSGGVLKDHGVTRDVDSVASFLGSAFAVDGPHEPLLVFGPGVTCHAGGGPASDVEGLLQGALFMFGKGRVAVFAEAGMFTAQINVWASGTRMGMNNPIAHDNARFLVSVVRWLTAAGTSP